MAESMVETLARAIYLAKPRNKPWGILGQHQLQYEKQARAVLEALKTPTEGMKMSTLGTLAYELQGAPAIAFTAAEKHIDLIWSAMIQAALNEGEGKR